MLESSNEPTNSNRKRRGWKWWLGLLLLLGICSSDNDARKRCEVGDEAFIRAISNAVGQWTVGDQKLFPTSLDKLETTEPNAVQFTASVAADSGWKGTAFGSVQLRKCRALVDQVQ